MTGIAGYITRTKEDLPSTLDRMAESMRYIECALVEKWRNDTIGICRVHHGTPSPNPQPTFSEDGSRLIFMDGEVFNEPSLEQARLGSQRNDAQYCLQLYEKLGHQAFKELNGSFSIAIYSLGNKELLLVTDRFSSHPLFYSITKDGTLFFSSRLSSLLQSPAVQRELDVTSIFEFLTFEKIFGTKTLYKTVHMVPPATVMSYRDANVEFNPYWRLEFKNIGGSDEYYAGKLAQVLKKAVERRTRDAPHRYGLLLSGGLDSRIVLAAADCKMTTLTASESWNREACIARKVAQTKGCSHLLIGLSNDHHVDGLDKAVELSDGLGGFEHAHLVGLFDRIRNECDILFHGTYLDDFNERYAPQRVVRILGKEIGFRKAKLRTDLLAEPYLASLSDQDFIQQMLDDPHSGRHILDENSIRVFRPEYAKQVVQHLRNSLRDMMQEASCRASLPSDKWNYVTTWGMLPKHRYFLFLNHIRAFMPERSVIFDNDLFEILLEMPPHLKRSGSAYRKALKKLDPKIASIANANTGLTPQIPRFLESIVTLVGSVRRRTVPSRSLSTTHGWGNFSELLRQNEKLKTVVEETIRDPECLNPAIFDHERILQMFREHLNLKADHAMLFLLLLTLGRWCKKYGPRTRN